MKRILLSFMVLFSVIILTGCKSKKNDYGDIIDLSFSYGSYNGGYYNYSISESNGVIYYRANGSNGVQLDVIKEIDFSYLDKIKKIVNEYNVDEWNGYNERDDSVLDGSSFSLNIQYMDKTISASGYMKYPKNYNKVKEKLLKLFDEINMIEVKDDLIFSLDSNSSTGYSWNYELSELGIVDVSSHYDDSGCGNRDGCGGYNVYTVKSLSPGTVTLTLTYSFVDPEKYDSKTAVYEITVNDDLSITETHYGSYFEKD